ERMILVTPLTAGPQPISVVRAPGKRNDGAPEAHLRNDAFLEPVDEPLDPADDRVQAKVTAIIHEDVLQPVERAGQVRFGGQVAPSRDRDVLAGVLVGNLVEDVGEGPACPGMPVVVMRMALVVFGPGAQLAATLPERSDC